MSDATIIVLSAMVAFLVGVCMNLIRWVRDLYRQIDVLRILRRADRLSPKDPQ